MRRSSSLAGGAPSHGGRSDSRSDHSLQGEDAGPRSGSGRGRPGTRWLLIAAALVAAAAGGVLLWNRIAQVQQGGIPPQIAPGVTRDPATRARGAVVSLSGEASHPVAAYDPASGTVSVRFQSRYYDPQHTPQLNRQYLATEGRLVVQLILYNTPQVSRAVAELYHGSERLATIRGAQGQAYSAYTVDYARTLP